MGVHYTWPALLRGGGAAQPARRQLQAAHLSLSLSLSLRRSLSRSRSCTRRCTQLAYTEEGQHMQSRPGCRRHLLHMCTRSHPPRPALHRLARLLHRAPCRLCWSGAGPLGHGPATCACCRACPCRPPCCHAPVLGRRRGQVGGDGVQGTACEGWLAIRRTPTASWARVGSKRWRRRARSRRTVGRRWQCQLRPYLGLPLRPSACLAVRERGLRERSDPGLADA